VPETPESEQQEHPAVPPAPPAPPGLQAPLAPEPPEPQPPRAPAELQAAQQAQSVRRARPERSRAPERLVLGVGLLGGLLLLGVTPPFQVPDESVHFFHIYQLATGAAIETVPGAAGGAGDIREGGVGGEGRGGRDVSGARGGGGVRGIRVPASLPAIADLCVDDLPFHPERRLAPGVLTAAWQMPLAPQRSTLLPVGQLSPYGPVPYLGAVPAVALGRMAGARPLLLLYLARLGNLALALALVWAAVRIAPVFRWLFALLALTPMAMFERSSASADAFTDAIGLLLAACVLALALGARRRVSDGAQEIDERGGREDRPERWRRGAVWMATAAMLLAAAKAAYFLVDLIVFLVPAARLGSPRRAAAVRAAGLAAMAGGGAMSWWSARSYFALAVSRPGIQPAAQLRGIAAAPLHFLALALADLVRHAARYLVGFVGNFGWLDTPLPPAAVVLWAAMLLAVALTDGDREVLLAPWQRWLAAGAVAATLLALGAAQYVVWTRLGSGEIDGIQGRYYLPVAPAAALLVYNRRWAGRWPAGAGAAWRLGGISAVYTLASLVRIWFRYHGA
jgi:hypothetical protein